IVAPIGRGAPAEPDTEDLDAAIVADGPHGCSGIATAARRHTGCQVLVIAVGCGDAAALLAGGDSGSADGLAGPRPCVFPGGCSAADDGQRYCAGPEVDHAGDECPCSAGALIAHGCCGGAVAGGDCVGVRVGAGVGVADGAQVGRG